MISNAWTLTAAQIAIEAAAILAFAISGLLEAAQKKLDAVGVCIVVGLSAFGGGTLRDIAASMPAIVAVLMGMITAVFGGVLLGLTSWVGLLAGAVAGDRPARTGTVF